MRVILLVLAATGCDRVFGLGDPYEDARVASDVASDVVIDVAPPGDVTMPPLAPIAHFSFDHDLNDDTETYIGTDIGNISTPPGHTGNALQLDGQSCLEIALPQTPAAFTIAFWGRPASLKDATLISRKVFDQMLGYSWLVYETQANSAFGFQISDSGAANDGFTPSAFTAGAWHHYAVTFDGMNKNWWLDGTMVFTQPGSMVGYGTTQKEYVGCRDGISGYFDGLIDEVYFYDLALNKTQILGLAAQ